MELSEPSLSDGIGACSSRCGHWSSGQPSLCSKHFAEGSFPDVSESETGNVIVLICNSCGVKNLDRVARSARIVRAGPLHPRQGPGSPVEVLFGHGRHTTPDCRGGHNPSGPLRQLGSLRGPVPSASSSASRQWAPGTHTPGAFAAGKCRRIDAGGSSWIGWSSSVVPGSALIPADSSRGFDARFSGPPPRRGRRGEEAGRPAAAGTERRSARSGGALGPGRSRLPRTIGGGTRPVDPAEHILHST